MAEYVPETVDVRHAWSLYWYQEISAYKTLDQYEAEFDRWLARHDRATAARAFQQGVERTLEIVRQDGLGLRTLIGNPYEETT